MRPDNAQDPRMHTPRFLNLSCQKVKSHFEKKCLTKNNNFTQFMEIVIYLIVNYLVYSKLQVKVCLEILFKFVLVPICL